MLSTGDDVESKKAQSLLWGQDKVSFEGAAKFVSVSVMSKMKGDEYDKYCGRSIDIMGDITRNFNHVLYVNDQTLSLVFT